MRRRRYVLAFDSFGHPFIFVDYRTPFYKLERLDHIHGVYESPTLAYNFGVRLLRQRIDNIQSDIKKLNKCKNNIIREEKK